MGRTPSEPDGIPYIPYDPDHPTPEHLLVLEFFRKVYPDHAVRHYVLLKESACLEGENREQKLWFCTGRGSNGKSMLQILMQLTFGEYAASFSPTVFTRNRADGGSANPELIVLRAKRYAYTSEPDIGEKIKTALVKQFTGGEPLNIRGLYCDQESITIMARPDMACNDIPAVDSTDGGAQRRWAVIPHVALFVDAGKPVDPTNHIYYKDRDLPEKMKKWNVAFLGILVHYYKIYMTDGLVEPELVVRATDKYKHDNDTFTAFAAEHLVVESGAGPIKFTKVYEVYKDWKRTSGMLEMKKAVLIDRMKSIAAKGSTDTEFKGVRFKEEGEAEPLSETLSVSH
jgi:putative DNA primase/helicase